MIKTFIVFLKNSLWKKFHCKFELNLRIYFSPDSLIIRKRKELLDFSEKLENLSLDIGLSNLYSEFKEFKNLKEPKFTNENDIEIPKIEKVKKAEIIEINSSPVIYNKDTQFLPSNTAYQELRLIIRMISRAILSFRWI